MRVVSNSRDDRTYRRRCTHCAVLLEVQQQDAGPDNCITCPRCSTRFNVFAVFAWKRGTS